MCRVPLGPYGQDEPDTRRSSVDPQGKGGHTDAFANDGSSACQYGLATQRGTILYVVVIVESMRLLLGMLKQVDILAKTQDIMVAMMMDMTHTN